MGGLLFIVAIVKNNYLIFLYIASATFLSTNLSILPLCLAISLIMLEDKKPNSSAGLMNTLSISGFIDLFMLANCTSYSKSDMALKPLNITVAECS